MKGINSLMMQEGRFRVIVWGAGNIGRYIYQVMTQCTNNITVVAITDSERLTIKGMEYMGEIVRKTECVKELSFDYVIIATNIEKNVAEILDKLRLYGVEEKRIIKFENPSIYNLLRYRIHQDSFLQEICYRILNSFSCFDQDELLLANSELRKVVGIVLNMQYYKSSRIWYISENKECVYLDIPKAAGSSVISSICNIEADMNELYKIARMYSSLHCAPLDCTGLKFTFVRDPFARILSCYKNKVEGKEVTNFYGEEINYLKIEGISSDRGFSSFINAIARIPDEWSERHFKSQYSMIYENGEPIVDYIGRVENFDEDFKTIRDKFHIENNRYMNKSSTYMLEQYYTLDLVETVYLRYEKDIKTFGYYDSYLKLKASFKK